jgi:hypothetical protein
VSNTHEYINRFQIPGHEEFSIHLVLNTCICHRQDKRIGHNVGRRLRYLHDIDRKSFNKRLLFGQEI